MDLNKGPDSLANYKFALSIYYVKHFSIAMTSVLKSSPWELLNCLSNIGAFTQVDLWQQRVSGQPDVHLGKSVDRLFSLF